MNIVILGPAHPLRPGGITTFNERLCKAFLQAGHRCAIWSFSLQYPNFLFPGSSQFVDTPPPVGIEIHSVINSINPFNWLKIGRRLRQLNPDLIVVRFWIPFMGPCLGTILRIVKKNKHTRIVCLADNIIPHEHRPGDKLFTRYFIQPIDSFVVMSQQVLQDLSTFTTKKAQYLPHPLYDNFGEKETAPQAREAIRQQFGLPIANGDKLLIFFGLVRKYKGLDLLLEALAQTKDSTIKLLIAGEFYEPQEPFTRQIEALSLQNRVYLHPHFVADAHVRHFICAADCVVQPYRNATQSGVTPVAYHFEVPMIVTNVGGLPEMVPHGIAGLVAEANPAALAQAIDAYFEQGKNYFMPGLLQEKKKLGWASMTAAMVQL